MKKGTRIKDRVRACVLNNIVLSVGFRVGSRVQDHVHDRVCVRIWSRVWASVWARIRVRVGDRVRDRLNCPGRLRTAFKKTLKKHVLLRFDRGDMKKDIKVTECDNIFCLHYEPNGRNISAWNKTKCSYYEVDPYDKKNPTGIKIEDCEALKRFKKYGW